MKRMPNTILSAISILLFLVVTNSTKGMAQEDIISTTNQAQDLPGLWTLIKIFPKEERIPGIGLRTTALFAANGKIIKAYCLEPGLPIPPVGMVCRLDITGVFQCGIFQRFRPIPLQPTPTPPPPTPTPKPLSCEDLGLGLHVVYGKNKNSDQSKPVGLALVMNTREFRLEPLAIAPEELWNKNPIYMFTPNSTCGTFTVFGNPSDLPPEVIDIKVTVDCPGVHLDLSSESADGNYCFNCRDIHFSQKMCKVSNFLTIQSFGQTQVCQAFYMVIDPPRKSHWKGK
jgi:hypothetical protein